MSVSQIKAARRRMAQKPKAARARRMTLLAKPKPMGLKAKNRR